jgi:hypothetical protein
MDPNACLEKSTRIPTTVFEIEDHFGEDHGCVRDVHPDNPVEVGDQFIEDTRQVSNEHQ